MDKIFIESLKVRGKHGVSDEERAREQEFIVDITIEFDTRGAASSDDLADTVDYSFFREQAKDVIERESFRLLERLADTLAQAVLEDERVATVSVTIRKSEMFPDCTPGVTITRTR